MFRCMGCNAQIPWDGTGMFSFTCSCGATIFLSEETSQVALPVAVALGISEGRTTPHLDDLVGNSDFSSIVKTQIIGELRDKGFTWMRECEQCRTDGTLEHREWRTRREKRRVEILEQALAEDWNIEQIIQAQVEADKEQWR